MKRKLFFIFLLFCGTLLNAQEFYDSLIITEVRLDRGENFYLEITNMGNQEVQLSDFKLGYLFNSQAPYTSFPGQTMFFQDYTLGPGETYLLAQVYDEALKNWLKEPDEYSPGNKPELWALADHQHHSLEGGGPEDSIPDPYVEFRNLIWEGDVFFLEHHVNGDSAVVDQVGGVFLQDNGTNGNVAFDVAGFPRATREAILIRKFDVKKGNLDFNNARGIDITDSEWIPIPISYIQDPNAEWVNVEPYRRVFYTVGNHGDYNLDETTLVSDKATVDWNTKKITVPWGTRNLDNFMDLFEKKEGLAWRYKLSPNHEDSAFSSARTGDLITFYVCGNDLDVEQFEILVSEPGADANIVVPKYMTEADGYYGSSILSGNAEVFKVTDGDPGMDTIFFAGIVGPFRTNLVGIEYATHVDTLFKYLEKPGNANWEIDWVDGTERTYLKHGDLLKVTAQNGSEKYYFIKMNEYENSHDASLSSITWPDIPDYYKGAFGWKGDTIPGFSNQATSYSLTVPLDVEGIPSLVGKTNNLNARFEVNRAKSINGTVADRTTSFNVTAEDDTSTMVYNILLSKEKDPNNIQPFIAEPFISEYVHMDQNQNGFLEICNPGTEILDLSNYMIVRGGSGNPAEAIQAYTDPEGWYDRYMKYVPGYKWVDSLSWTISPGFLEKDLTVNSLVMPGDVFVMGHIHLVRWSGYPWWASENCDVQFAHRPDGSFPWGGWGNNWGEKVAINTVARTNHIINDNIYLFKILNDSVKEGTKPAIDPNDFELIEVWGTGDGTSWVVGGVDNGTDWRAFRTFSYVRKPQYFQGRTGFKESFGTNPEDSEWIARDRVYWLDILEGDNDAAYKNVTSDIGKHLLNEITVHQSIVSSAIYKVSDGYSSSETIKGIKTGTTVDAFLELIIKKDENQVLTILADSDGSELTGSTVLSNNDALVVVSANGENTTKYFIEVTEQGLSSDAVLTSTSYTINTSGSASISGFDYGTALTTVLDNVTVPAEATLTIIDEIGNYVPLQQLNFDTLYVDAEVNDKIFFEVVAEDKTTSILYQLLPNASTDAAFVLSSVYSVNQDHLLISLVPRGTEVGTFISYLVPSTGATVKLVDKLGVEKVDGPVVQDDRILVTAADGVTQTMYFLSMLATELIPESDYLAYVTSDEYSVDQFGMLITGPSTSTPMAEFFEKLIPSEGATMMVVDSEGVEQTDGLSTGDMLKVTSADESVSVMYELDLTVGISDRFHQGEVVLFPNPFTAEFSINGLESGARIKVFNQTGSVISDRIAQGDRMSISLDGYRSGIYLVLITRQDKLIGTYKVVKQ